MGGSKGERDPGVPGNSGAQSMLISGILRLVWITITLTWFQRYSWIYDLILFINFNKFLTIISSYISSTLILSFWDFNYIICYCHTCIFFMNFSLCTSILFLLICF